MPNKDNEQKFPLTALIVILVLIVLASLGLMSVKTSAVMPSPDFHGDNTTLLQKELQHSVNMNDEYFYPIRFQSEGISDEFMIPPAFGSTVLKSMDLYDLKKYKESEDLLRTLFLYYPDSAFVAQLLGNALFARKQYHTAENYYRTAMKLSKAHQPLLYNNLAMSQAMQNKLPDAISNMEKAVRYSHGLLPKSEWNLAGLYLRAGEKERSLKLFIELLKKTPPALLNDIEWDPVFKPLFQNEEVRKILKEKTGKDHKP